MECVDTFVAPGSGLFALYYHLEAPGEHLSRVYYCSDPAGSTVRLVAEVNEWLVSLSAGSLGNVFAASWDGRILALSPDTRVVAECDLLGTIKLAGFDDTLRFLMGEEGHIFEATPGGTWTRLKMRSKADVYGVARRGPDDFLFVGSSGKLINYRPGTSPTLEELPTSADLHAVAFRGPGDGAVGGENGTLFLYRNGSWEDHSVEGESIHDICTFRGRLIVSMQEAGTFAVTDAGALTKLSGLESYYLTADDKHLATFTDDALVIYDGTTFHDIPHTRILGGDI